MMTARRHELSDRQWALLSDALPPNGRRGGQWRPHRRLLNAMFWRLHTGASWRDLPGRYGPWETVYYRFRRWQKDGTLRRLLDRLQLRLDEQGCIDWDTWCVDGSNVRAARPAAGAKKGAPKPHSDARMEAGDPSSIS
jgi:transposase